LLCGLSLSVEVMLLPFAAQHHLGGGGRTWAVLDLTSL
jgi:hypothetical protein